ncbi:GntR family transcriptional regulator [Nocardioides sp. zg-DK7169]|uniref:GntR family transcriptional regulator n=1 Tax=Nocardioides sp. zg-DK7169 TaxID=2736600 RepID=UPI001552AA42|nr:GntR family transcriptional regulator [Nocardioides sp. zg-DK7169]NPC98021.1 GntR family transcriptional regulator [Nocardioides sp. zg-DK7169]
MPPSPTILPLDPDSPVAPYEQLRAQVASRAAAGALPAGTRLPTVRALAAELGVAANTVARAYRELEGDGVVVTEGRRGTFVASGAPAASDAAQRAAAAYVAEARRLGLTRAEAVRLLESGWGA